MEDIQAIIAGYSSSVKAHRIWLHQHPEKSGEEVQTAAYIANVLRSMGLDPQERVGGYGVTALIVGNFEGPCIGLRADIDALQIEEQSGVSFCSLSPGMMHACGHDAHAAMLLGAAYVLNEMNARLHGSVKLIFQPSEENSADSGAKKMIASGVLQDPRVDVMFAQHVQPNWPVGTVAVMPGNISAASDRFFMTIHGHSSHGASPEKGIDAIVIASQVVTALQSIVSRNVSPSDSAVITIGRIEGGSRYNIIAEDVMLEGTCRTLDEEVRQSMPARIESIARGIAEGMGGSCTFRYVKGYDPTTNNSECFETICRVVRDGFGEDALTIPQKPTLGGEDFSFFSHEVPSGYFWLGCRDPLEPFYPLHSNKFIPSWDALPIGIEVLVRAALRYLAADER